MKVRAEPGSVIWEAYLDVLGENGERGIRDVENL